MTTVASMTASGQAHEPATPLWLAGDVNAQPPLAGELIHRRLHPEHARLDLAVQVVVSREDAALAHLRSPEENVVTDGVVVVLRVEVDEVELTGGKPGGGLRREHPQDL